MKILLASSEVHPYSKTGGLADMVGALGKHLARNGHQVGLVTPLYAGIRDRFPEIERFNWPLDLPLGLRRLQGGVWTLEPSERLTIYFIEQPDFYSRPSLYQNDGADYPDNAERFIFLSKAVVHLARHLPWQPELVHVHDWQAAMVPLLIQHEELFAGWRNAPRTCTTIHNLAYQGLFPAERYALTNLPQEEFNPSGAEFYGQLNCLKAGIAYGDLITTVSPRYAREITTPEFGCGLDGLLRKRQLDLQGILNGVDYDEWNTTHNPFLKAPYSAEDLSGKAINKVELQRRMGLPPDETIPLFGAITRLTEQKGIDIELGALEEMLSAGMQFILMGSGDREWERACRSLAERYPGKCAVKMEFNQAFSHLIEAGCDFYLMPSRFEPSGLNQMYSLHYGTVAIVRATGGLDDAITDISEDVDRADGIKFYEYSSGALAKAIRKALILYQEKPLLDHYRRNGMARDFSWERTASSYERVYRRVLGIDAVSSCRKDDQR